MRPTLLAESTQYQVTHENETVYLLFRNSGRARVCIGDFYDDPECAIISRDEKYVVMGGCGVIVYFLQEPFAEYRYDTPSPQHYEFHRNPGDIWWADTVYQSSTDAEDEYFRFVREQEAANVTVYLENVETREVQRIS